MMAQIVDYYEDDVEFTQGPFVAVRIGSSNLRVEVECKGHKCPILPDASIYEFARKRKLDMGNSNVTIGHVQDTVNLLNVMVLSKQIYLHNNIYVY